MDCAEVSPAAWPSLRDGHRRHGRRERRRGGRRDARARRRSGYAIGDCGAAPLAALRALMTADEGAPLRAAAGLDQDGARRAARRHRGRHGSLRLRRRSRLATPPVSSSQPEASAAHAGIGSSASAPKAARRPRRAARARARRAPGRRRGSPARAHPARARAARRPRAAARPGTAARPDWRVPSISPSPRSSRSISASLKPSRCSASARSRARLLGPEQQAQRLVRAAADPPAQLVQLRDPVALGVLDEHHRSRSGRRCRPRSPSWRPARRRRPRRTRPSPPASRAAVAGRAAARRGSP